MGKQLILAEKPSVAREIARVLGARQKQNGYIEGPGYVVTWALGHLVTLAEPEAYGNRYSKWSLETLPMLPEKMELVVIAQTAKQFGVIRQLMSRSDVTGLVIATDSGREGELVARWIMEKANFRKPATRLWISSQTDKAINDGFRNLKPASAYDNLFKSAVCRAQADWLVGLNVTRALTCKHNAQLSAGRVQTPTLAMIIKREEEIRGFVPKEFYRIAALAAANSAAGKLPAVNSQAANSAMSSSQAGQQPVTLMWQEARTGSSRIYDKDTAMRIVSKCEGKPARVLSVKKQRKLEPAPQAYDLTELQRDANRLYSFSAKKTLTLLQGLYEIHKLVTYPRTDSRYISRDVAATLRERLMAVNKGTYAKIAGGILRSGIRTNERFVNDSKVTDHHAIIPTEQPMNMAALENEEKRIYDLIVKRFLAVLSSAYEYDETTVTADIAGERFITRGRTVIAPGWRDVYSAGVGLSGGESGGGSLDAAVNGYGGGSGSGGGHGYGGDSDDSGDEDDLTAIKSGAKGHSGASLPPLREGDRLSVTSVRSVPAKTKPPARYTEATLLTAMEHPGKFIDSKELKETLESVSGIGTPATRADIIEKLFDSFYVERGGKSGKEILPTSKGKQLVGLVPDDLRSAELTARWEQQLENISKGRKGATDAEFIRDIRMYASKLVSSVVASSGEFKHDNLTRERCPDCGEFLLSVQGKKGEMLICQDRECGYRRSVEIITNARCPNCHKKLSLKGEGAARSFHCLCGYRERLSDFEARKESTVSKKEVERFLTGQRQENSMAGGLNSSLAEQLKALGMGKR